jgi:hypothetical protein
MTVTMDLTVATDAGARVDTCGIAHRGWERT